MQGINKITECIIGKAIEVHRVLGPGLLESAYTSCLAYELKSTEYPVELELELPVVYKGINVDCNFRLDMLVGKKVIVEVKSVEKLLPVHKAQLLTYLKLTGLSIGLLINFNAEVLTKGIQRVINSKTSVSYE